MGRDSLEICQAVSFSRPCSLKEELTRHLARLTYICVWTTIADSVSPCHLDHRSIRVRDSAGPDNGSCQLSLAPGESHTAPQAGCVKIGSHERVSCVRIQ